MKRALFCQLVGRYFGNIALGLDGLCNAMLGGDPRETISSRSAKWRMKGNRFAYYLCSVLNCFQRHHCVQARRDNVGNEGVIPD